MEFLNEAGSEERVIHSGGPLRIRFHYQCHRDIPNLHFGLRLYSSLGILMSEIHTDSTNQAVDLARKGKGCIDLEIDFLNLMPGTYYAGLFAAIWNEYQDWLENVARIEIEPSDYYGTGRGVEARCGLVFFPFRWKLRENAPPDPAETSAVPLTSTLVQRDRQIELLNCRRRTNSLCPR